MSSTREQTEREFQLHGQSHAGETATLGWRTSAMVDEIVRLRAIEAAAQALREAIEDKGADWREYDTRMYKADLALFAALDALSASKAQYAVVPEHTFDDLRRMALDVDPDTGGIMANAPDTGRIQEADMTQDEIKRERERIDREVNELEERMDTLGEESQHLQQTCKHPNMEQYKAMGEDAYSCPDCGHME